MTMQLIGDRLLERSGLQLFDSDAQQRDDLLAQATGALGPGVVRELRARSEEATVDEAISMAQTSLSAMASSGDAVGAANWTSPLDP